MPSYNSNSDRHNKLLVQEKDAGGSGNCFYFSIYDALNERGLVNKFANKYSTFRKKQSVHEYIDSYGKSQIYTYNFTTKDNFNLTLRHMIADILFQNETILKNLYILLEKTYDDFKTEYPNSVLADDIFYLSSTTENEPWLIEKFLEVKLNTPPLPTFKKSKAVPIEPGTFDLFKRSVQDSIVTVDNEAQEIETIAAHALFKYAGIELVIVTKKPITSGELIKTEKFNTGYVGLKLHINEKKMIAKHERNIQAQYKWGHLTHYKKMPIYLPLEDNRGIPIIYIVHLPNEGHYRYFSFENTYDTYQGGSTNQGGSHYKTIKRRNNIKNKKTNKRKF